jgi:hypothetical protein
MINSEYENIAPWKKELSRKIGLLGLSDLRRLSPVGDLGYANGWDWGYMGRKGWFYGDMEKAVMRAFDEQGFRFDKGYSSGYRGTDHHCICTELKLSYSYDSGD